MVNHDEDCERKPRECPYCEQFLRMRDYHNHIEFCGAKTRPCEQCKALIQLKSKPFIE